MQKLHSIWSSVSYLAKLKLNRIAHLILACIQMPYALPWTPDSLLSDLAIGGAFKIVTKHSDFIRFFFSLVVISEVYASESG